MVGSQSWISVCVFLHFRSEVFKCWCRDTWCKDIRYLAVKILTAAATRGHQRNELEYLKAIRDLGDDRPYIPMLRDDFEEEGPHGVHLCLVMDILSTDVSSFRRSAPDKCLPLYMTKMIVALMVESLESLHDLNIIHTGLCRFYDTT